MATGFRFGFKKTPAESSAVSSPRSEKASSVASSSRPSSAVSSVSSRLTRVFEDAAHADARGVQSRSVVTALGATGFDTKTLVDYRKKAVIIPCKHSLPPPSRSRYKGEVLEVRRRQRLATSEAPPPGASAEYGLTGAHLPVDDAGDDIGPPMDEIMEWRRRRRAETDSEADSGPEPKKKPILAAANPRLYTMRKQYGTDDQRLLREEIDALPEFTHESFDAVPVESFGLAMLMGMGYDPKKHTQKPAELHKRVYQRAGLGADAEFERHLVESQDAAAPKLPKLPIRPRS